MGDKVKIVADGTGEQTQPRRFLIKSQESMILEASSQLKRVTNESNSVILNDLRSLVRNQVEQLRAQTANDVMTAPQATVMLKLAQTYKLMNDETKSEQRNYDFTAMTEEELKKLAGPGAE